MKQINVTEAFYTTLPAEKVKKVADEANVKVIHTETRYAGGKWINDFEVCGAPGKVQSFMEKINDIRHD